MSKIIFLNGCGSSGKTSIARSIQDKSSDLWLNFGVDTFIDMIPSQKQEQYFKFIHGQNERGHQVSIETGIEGKKLFDVMPKFAELLADQGNNLLIDEVLLNERALKTYVQQLKKYTVYYIGVLCDLSVLQEREVLRGDRVLGLSNGQIDRVHHGILNSYDLTVDTTRISSLEAADLILKFIEEHSKPSAFKRLELLIES